MITRKGRIRGVLVATAAGDALGAGYEFGPPLSAATPVLMNGGGMFRWEPGEWTDDTSMTISVARAASVGDLRMETTQDYLVREWVAWSRVASDVGVQTRRVLAGAQFAADSRANSARLHKNTGRTGGNGSLMRTAPLALAYLNDPAGLTEAATAVSNLTHFDPEAAEACVIWTHAIRHAVLTGKLDVYVGLTQLSYERGRVWALRLERAEKMAPRDFRHNGWVVEALQAAWCAISTTADAPKGKHLQLALEAAVRGGKDTDTVAAIAGGLLGAAYGDKAVPRAWRDKLHGWPTMRTRDLARLAEGIAR